jgi:hypothetical protein
MAEALTTYKFFIIWTFDLSTGRKRMHNMTVQIFQRGLFVQGEPNDKRKNC